MEAYHAALAGLPISGSAARLESGSLSAAIVAYYLHNSFLYGFSVETQKMRRAILERFRSDHGARPIAMLQREHIAKILGSKRPFAARNWLKTIRGLMQFCLEVGLIKEDPTVGIKPAKAGKTEGFHTWTEDEIAQYEARHPIGSRARLAMALLLYTAQRRSDIVRIGPQHVRNDTMVVRAQKTSRTTGVTLEIPIHPVLAEVLAKTPSAHLTFLVTEAGAPFTAAGFGNKFREYCDEAGLGHCSAHGLRYAQCTRLADAGCSAHQIAAISGHRSLKMVEKYTRAADQRRLARAAIAAVTMAQASVAVSTDANENGTQSGKP
jgi:integrase